MRVTINYSSVQDDDGFYHQVIGNKIVNRKFKTEKGLRDWVITKHFLFTHLGIPLILMLLLMMFR